MQYRWVHRGPHSVWTDVWIWQMLQRSVRGGGLQTHRWQQTTAPLAGGSWTRQAAWTGFWIIQHKLTPSPTAPAAVHHEECHPPFFFSSVIYSPGNKTLPNVLKGLYSEFLRFLRWNIHFPHHGSWKEIVTFFCWIRQKMPSQFSGLSTCGRRKLIVSRSAAVWQPLNWLHNASIVLSRRAAMLKQVTGRTQRRSWHERIDGVVLNTKHHHSKANSPGVDKLRGRKAGLIEVTKMTKFSLKPLKKWMF